MQINKCFKLLLAVLFFVLAPGLAPGQVQNGITFPLNESAIIKTIHENASGSYFLLFEPSAPSNEPYRVIKTNAHGIELNSKALSDTSIVNINFRDEYLVLCVQSNVNWPQSDIVIIVLDSNLNELTRTTPIKKNWPRSNFVNRSFESQVVNGQVAYFGVFFNNSMIDPDRIQGWLFLSGNFDTLLFSGLGITNDSVRNRTLYPLNGNGFIANGFTTLVTQAWSSTINVSQIHSFDDSLRFIQSKAAYFNSPFPNFPRVLSNDGMRNLVYNEHSLYLSTIFESATSTSFSDVIRTFSIIQLDHQLNFKKWHHSPVNQGKSAENNFTISNISFDTHNQFLYVIGNDCTPPALGLSNQNRHCGIRVIKLDTSLNLIWEKNIDIPNTHLRAVTLAPASDAGVLIGGYKIDPSPSLAIERPFLVKLDSAGNHSVSVPELAAEKPQVQLYPNPTSGSVHLHWQQGQYQRFGLFNLKGQQVYHSELDPGSNLHQLSLPNLPAGLYFYQLTGPSGTVSGKLVKN